MTPGSSKEPLVQGLDGVEEIVKLHLCEPNDQSPPAFGQMVSQVCSDKAEMNLNVDADKLTGKHVQDHHNKLQHKLKRIFNL